MENVHYHQSNLSSFQLTARPKDRAEKKTMEIKFAVAIACNSAITSIDHLVEKITSYGASSQSEKMKLHRTKFASLNKDVISPASYDDLSMIRKERHNVL